MKPVDQPFIRDNDYECEKKEEIEKKNFDSNHKYNFTGYKIQFQSKCNQNSEKNDDEINNINFLCEKKPERFKTYIPSIIFERKHQSFNQSIDRIDRSFN
ncbi:hypothetical protein DERF_008776 [Dermatophagoides farinae]|uniref:Uncharacterized protein n=1 Tax=Dermatophagoides farinae TaxID=6954 RepID=A0A922I128_DERFA|nr:hypothetical protein DERF_008776 [Dermatophagoides farinae]